MRHGAKLILVAAWLAATSASADKSTAAEIEALLERIGRSGCAFIRNNTSHSSTAAESHLRLKYRRAGTQIKTAEDFIERVASQSFWTGRPYRVHCPESPREPATSWLSSQLLELRSE